MADLVSDQQRLEAASDAMIGQTERLIVMLATGGTLLGGILAVLLGRDARARRRQIRRRAARPRP